MNLAIAEPLSTEALTEIEEQITDRLAFFIVCEHEIVNALEWYNTGEETLKRPSRSVSRALGDLLVDLGAVSLQALETALKEYDVTRDGRVGAYLVAQGAITQVQLDTALERQMELTARFVRLQEAAWEK